MSIATVIRHPVTAPGYLLKLNSGHYCNRKPVDYLGETWEYLAFDVSGLTASGGAQQKTKLTIVDSDRAWTQFLDSNGIDNIAIEIYQLYEVQNLGNEYNKIFAGEVTSGSSDGEKIVLDISGVKADYSYTPRNRWISPFANVSTGSVIVIGTETLRFE